MSYDNEWNRERPRRSRRRQTGQERKREREQQEDHGPELDISLGRREPLPEPEPLKPASRVSRAREKQQKKRKKHKLILIAVEVLVFLGIVAFLIYSYLKSSMDLIQRLPFDEQQVMNLELTEEKQEQMKGYWTIAVFGVDDRGTVIGKGTHADVNIICNINQDTGEIKLVSVYRDTYLNINDKNSYNKINQAYFDGGPEQAVRALNRNLDLNMTDYVTFNWKAVADAINILGGVDLELSKAEFYYINAFITETVEATGIPSKHLTHAGMNHLDGVQAVAYGRLRLMDTDFARTERQRKVINLGDAQRHHPDCVPQPGHQRGDERGGGSGLGYKQASHERDQRIPDGEKRRAHGLQGRLRHSADAGEQRGASSSVPVRRRELQSDGRGEDDQRQNFGGQRTLQGGDPAGR